MIFLFNVELEFYLITFPLFPSDSAELVAGPQGKGNDLLEGLFCAL